MPCYSTIRTQMNNADNLGAALAALGYAVTKSQNSVTGRKGTEFIAFSRLRSGDAFSASGDTDNLGTVGKKYAEVGVKSWAKTKGFSVLAGDSESVTLVNRRTF